MKAGEVATALDLIGRKQRGEKAPVACCPECPDPTPLVSTLIFSYAEFYCLECGGRYGFLEARAEEETEQLRERREANLRAWKDLSAGICVQGRVPYDAPGAVEAHHAAMRRLSERRSRPRPESPMERSLRNQAGLA